ncbi:hypothetical protein QQS21_002589 [Conoideocrella luteorostrata]|uniref:Uncharacterized protein n=1 Tax=Conoideocrella luteorostrata TaxID=1105319 RepID=A0AAJ0CUW8_9HYPO|nr:hypothetical protein QQS21_002589 [Conoideocrella luteorostrata]
MDSSPTSFAGIPSDVGYSGASLDLSGFQDDIVISYLLSKFSIGFGDRIPNGADAPTMAVVLTGGMGKSSAYLSGLSLAQAFFGRVHNDDEMSRQSVQLYGRALTNLRRDLQLADQEEARPRAYMNLWTSLFLGLYEMVSSAGSSKWLQHSMGVSALTQLAGPEAFQSQAANAMLESYRSFIAVGHLVQRKHCFLAQPEWKTIPWAGKGPPKTLTSLICDVLCDIPGLMQDVDAMLESHKLGHDISADKVILQETVINSIDQLSWLRWQWEAAYPYACAERPTTTDSCVTVDEYGHPLFETHFEFDSLDRAIDVLNYNSIRLMLYTLGDSACITDLQLTSSSEYLLREGPGSNPLVLPGQGDRIGHALEICRSAEYMMQESRDSQGLLILLFPLRVAFTHLQKMPKISTWIQRVLGMSGSKGFKLGEHILNLQSQSKPPMKVNAVK